MSQKGIIQGTVTRFGGDSFPKIVPSTGGGPSALGSRCSVTPISVPLYVLRGKVPGHDTDVAPRVPRTRAQHSQLGVVALVQSDSAGHYKVEVDPGTYTLMMDLGEETLYQNYGDDDGNYSSLEVKAGEIVDQDLRDYRDHSY